MTPADRLYGLLIRAYPVSHQAEFGAEMRQAFGALNRNYRTRGLFRYVLFLIWEMAGTLYHASRERVAQILGRGAYGGQGPHRGQGVWGLAERWAQDLRHAFRSVRRSPGFTAVAVLTTALGIGATVTVYSVVRAVLLTPLPYRDAHQIVHVWSRATFAPKVMGALRDVADYREWTTLFDGFASKSVLPADRTITGGGTAENVRTEIVTSNLFSLLGVDAAYGRTFLPEDVIRFSQPPDNDTTPPPVMTAVISYGLWQRSFGADPGIEGRTFRMDGRPVTIIGVMPAGFRMLLPSERARDEPADVWLPQLRDPRDAQYGSRNQLILGRLKAGVTLAQAEAEMRGISARLREASPMYEREEVELFLEPALRDVVKTVNPALVVLSGAVGFLLLLSCANVANLLLVRGRSRSVDTAVRAALGCGRRRILRQLMMESAAIATMGGAAGVVMASVGLGALAAMSPPEVPRFDEVQLNMSVLVFALVVSMLSAVVFGLLPAFQNSRLNLAEVMKGQAGTLAGTGQRMVLGGSVVSAVALSVVLLMGAGLLARTFSEMQRIDPGFDPEGVLTFALQLYGDEYRGPARGAAVQALEGRIAALPGVEAVGSNLTVPFAGGGLWNGSYAWDEESEERYSDNARFRVATTDYFRAMAIPLRAGRFFTDAEMTERSSVAIVDEAVARRAWPGQDPIGKTVTATDNRTRLEVVGVVGTVGFRELTGEPRAAIYWPFGSRSIARLRVVVRGAGDPAALVGAIRATVKDFDPDLAVHGVTPLETAVSESMASTRFLLVLLELFAFIAVTLATVGLYSVIAFAVRQRTAEIGIRMALGARRERIVRLVFSQGLGLIGLGVALGTLATFVLGRFIESVIYGVSSTDPLTMLVVAVLVAGVSMLACCLPAWRGARTDPMVALRSS